MLNTVRGIYGRAVQPKLHRHSEVADAIGVTHLIRRIDPHVRPAVDSANMGQSW